MAERLRVRGFQTFQNHARAQYVLFSDRNCAEPAAALRDFVGAEAAVVHGDVGNVSAYVGSASII